MSSHNEVGILIPPATADITTAAVQEESFFDERLYRLVVYGPDLRFLGVVESVEVPSAKLAKRMTIRNLLWIDDNGRVGDVRNALDKDRGNVCLATSEDLQKFFPQKPFPLDGYLGPVRGTSYLLPVNLDLLCYGNTAVLAGINHGKSHLAALLVSQLHISGKKALVIDPSGEWQKLMDETSKTFSERANLKLSITYHKMDTKEAIMPVQERVFAANWNRQSNQQNDHD
ncbi:MAG: helicase HerA domain-containing protein [Candidatus Bathyarchaeia archaeon]